MTNFVLHLAASLHPRAGEVIMGLLDTIESMAGQSPQGGNNAQVAGGLMQALDEHPGGLQGVIQSFQQNGMAQHVQNWSTGQQQTDSAGRREHGADRQRRAEGRYLARNGEDRHGCSAANGAFALHPGWTAGAAAEWVRRDGKSDSWQAGLEQSASEEKRWRTFRLCRRSMLQ